MSDVVKYPEFMTTWHSSSRPYMEAWSSRNKANLMGSAVTSRRVPPFRAFDLLGSPNQSLVLLQNSDHRIGVESVCGAQEEFRRHVNFDTVYFQFAGHTKLETEYGEYNMAPGEIVLVPEGIAHRSTGSADSLRWFVRVYEPFNEFMAEDCHTSETSFELIRKNGPDWKIPAGAEQPKKSGKVKERMICWDDRPEDFTIAERDYDYLVGASSTHAREKHSGIRKYRIYDVFTHIAGTRGGWPPILRGPHLEIKTYNIIGEQWAFHRALRSEEIRIQFRGNAVDFSEMDNVPVRPGDVTVIPLGIAHSVITDPPNSLDFLRTNFYSSIPWTYPSDLTRHYFDSTFEVRTTVHREAAWKTAAQ